MSDSDAHSVPPLLRKLPVRDTRLIGALLVDAGRLRLEDVDPILTQQRKKKRRFGEMAVEMGLLSQEDVAFALGRQFDFHYLARGESGVSEEVVAAYAPFARQTEALRALRSQLMMRWFDTAPQRRALAIVSADRKDGRSFIAANLAVVFSQLGERTLLIDADMRNPRQHVLFGLDNAFGLSAVLAGRAGPEVLQRIPSLRHLSVLPAGAPPPNPQELLSRPLFPELLQQLATQLDVILIDTPATSESADAQVVTLRAGAALIMARRNAARRWRVQSTTDSLARNGATIVGAVLNSY